MNKKSIDSLPIEKKRVLIRVDFNVPIKDGVISDDTRIRESLPTIRHCIERGASVILCAHLGRPKGSPNPKYTLVPVAKKLEEILGREVLFAEDCVGEETKGLAGKLKPEQVLLLENLRYHTEEEKNSETFAKELASLADFFVQDAFGVVHRAHASTVGVPKFLPSAAGLLLQKELSSLSNLLKDPSRPFIALLGGAKVSDKIGVIKKLSTKADSIVIGGAMAYTFLKSQGFETGKSLVEEDKIELAKKLLGDSNKLILPKDHRTADKIEKGAKVEITRDENIAPGAIGIDIGPQSEERMEALIQSAKTIFWNGPMGIFEIPEFSSGTLRCARSVAKATESGAFSVVGGGDSIAAIKQSGFSKSITHISTGGGASLEFVEGKSLPGVEALPKEERSAVRA